MLVGLQGAGKTTTAGKLGSLLRKKGKKPLLVAGDVYRPAAIKQLQVLGEQLSLPVFALGDQVSPVEIARKAMDKAFSLACDTVIIDTAGRLHINEELITYVEDRKGHDRRYAIAPDKIKAEIGWYPETMFAEGIKKTIKWYFEHEDWMANVTSGDYQKYYEEMYRK